MGNTLYHLILLLPCSVCLFWAITLFLKRKTNNRSQNIWIVTAFLMSVSTLIWSISFSGNVNYKIFYKLDVLEAFTSLLLLPTLFLGFKSLVNEKAFGWRDYIWLTPALLIGSNMLILYSLMGSTNAIAYIEEVIRFKGKLVTLTDSVSQIQHLISVHIYSIFLSAQIVFILVYSTIHFIRYRKSLKNFFSSLEDKSVGNYLAILIGFYLILLLALTTYKGRFAYSGYPIFTTPLMLLWSILLYYMGYNVYQLKYTVDKFAKDLEVGDLEAVEYGYALREEDIYPTNEISPEDEFRNKAKKKQAELLYEFNEIIIENKVYLQNNLRMDDVARLMRTNRTYISRMLNEEYQGTFSDIINQKRIEYAQELMDSQPNLTQEEIAERSGFSYTSSFSRTFKQQTGMTFREYQKKKLF